MLTESQEIADTMPPMNSFREACEYIDRKFPMWREYWSPVQHDNIAEAMVFNY